MEVGLMDHGTERGFGASGRRPHWAVGVAGVFALVVVVVAPAAASWHGLIGFGRESLGLSGGWELVVPLTLDGAAFYAAVLALRSVLAGDSALIERLLVLAYAGASAAFNWLYALGHGGREAAVFFAGAAVSAAVVWDRTLRQSRQEQLRSVGAIEAPLPRFRVLRWVFDTRNTWVAWTTALREGIASPVEALAVARARREGVPALAPRAELGAPLPELARLSKVDALRTAWAALGVEAPESSDVRPALAWLAARGVELNDSYAYGQARREAERAAAGAGRRAVA